jgi:hypothetical protein
MGRELDRAFDCVKKPPQYDFARGPGCVPLRQFLGGVGLFAKGIVAVRYWAEDRVNAFEDGAASHDAVGSGKLGKQDKVVHIGVDGVEGWLERSSAPYPRWRNSRGIHELGWRHQSWSDSRWAAVCQIVQAMRSGRADGLGEELVRHVGDRLCDGTEVLGGFDPPHRQYHGERHELFFANVSW